MEFEILYWCSARVNNDFWMITEAICQGLADVGMNLASNYVSLT